jgi:hypothetical protein
LWRKVLRGRRTDRGGKSDHNKADLSAQDTTPTIRASNLAGNIWPYEGTACREMAAFQKPLQLRYFGDVGRDPPRLVAGE